MLKNPTCTTTTDAFMRYLLTDMCCLSASSTAVTSLEMTLNSAHQVTERLLISNICECLSENPPSSHLLVFREIPF